MLSRRLFLRERLFRWLTRRGGPLEPGAAFFEVTYFSGRVGKLVEMPGPRPRVLRVADRVLRLCPDPFLFERWGYERCGRDPLFAVVYYARRPWSWLLRLLT